MVSGDGVLLTNTSLECDDDLEFALRKASSVAAWYCDNFDQEVAAALCTAPDESTPDEFDQALNRASLIASYDEHIAAAGILSHIMPRTIRLVRPTFNMMRCQRQVLEGVPASPVPAKLTRRDAKGHLVLLHMYNLGPFTAWLNESVLKKANLGAFHCGIEVLGKEFSFGYCDSAKSGVRCSEPRAHRRFIFKESLCMGPSLLLKEQIIEELTSLSLAWPANSYHPLTRNCVHFARALLAALGAPGPFPDWVDGAADAARCSALLYPIADWGWHMLCARSRPSEPDEDLDGHV
jgi:hypothetical protein